MENDRFVLKEHANGQYWMVKDTITGYETAKKDCIRLINRLYKDMLSAHAIAKKNGERISELETMLYDVECELQEVEQENRRLMSLQGQL